MTCHEVAISQLRDSGHRLTPQRVMVLEAIYHSRGHLTVEEVHGQVQADSPYVDLSTIYRTLQFLKGQGLIGELRLDGEPMRYEAIRPGHEHHHALCTNCGRLLDIDHADMEGLAAHLLETYGFSASLVHMKVPGLCRACREHDPSGSREPA